MFTLIYIPQVLIVSSFIFIIKTTYTGGGVVLLNDLFAQSCERESAAISEYASERLKNIMLLTKPSLSYWVNLKR